MATKHVNISDPVYDEIECVIRKTYARSCILWIEEVENKELKSKFDTYVSNLKSIPNIRRLFHGTNEKAISNIIWNGFDPDRNTRSMYGKGVYFARDAKYSKNYLVSNSEGIAFMLVCDVALGKSSVGELNKKINGDSAVDNIKNPSIFVIDKVDAVYPKYIVAFYPKAF